VLALATVVCSACGGGNAGYSPTSPSVNNGSGTSVTPAANQVLATAGLAFTPASLSVAAGTTVTFTFESVQHDVVFDDASGAPANINPTAGTSVTRAFATRGAYGYQCTIHSGMRGTVTVN
jgi:plastocyanin